MNFTRTKMSKDLTIKLMRAKINFEKAKDLEKQKCYSEAEKSYCNAIYLLLRTTINDPMSQGERKQIANTCLVYKFHFDHLRDCINKKVNPKDQAPIKRLREQYAKGIKTKSNITHEDTHKALQALMADSQTAINAGNQKLFNELAELSWAFLGVLSTIETDEEKNKSDVINKDNKKKPKMKDVITAIKEKQNATSDVIRLNQTKEKQNVTEIKTETKVEKNRSDVIRLNQTKEKQNDAEIKTRPKGEKNLSDVIKAPSQDDQTRSDDVQDVIFADDKCTIFPENFDFEKAQREGELKLKQQELSNKIRQCRLTIKALNKRARQSSNSLERNSLKFESDILSMKLETLSADFEVLIDSKLKQSPGEQEKVEGKKQRRKRKSQERNKNDESDESLRNLPKEVNETSTDLTSRMILGISSQPKDQLYLIFSSREEPAYIDDSISHSI